MLEQLHLGGRRVVGFGSGRVFGLGDGGYQIDSTSVLSALGADPSTVYDAYQAQQGFQHMGAVFGQMEGITSTRDDCVKGCGADLTCSNNCSKAAVLSAEALATGIATVFNPIVGLAVSALFQVLNQVFGFAQGIGDPDCPNGPNPWPPSAADQQTLATATANIFTGTTAPGGAVPQGITDPFLLSIYLFRAQQSALIENCHWDQALSGNGTIAAQALMLHQWNLQHLGSPQTITRTVWSGHGSPPADYDQWTDFISMLYMVQNPKWQDGDLASVTVNRGQGLNPYVIQQGPGQAAPATSTGAKVVGVTAAAAGVGVLSLGAYAYTQGISMLDAWRRLKRAVTGG